MYSGLQFLKRLKTGISLGTYHINDVYSPKHCVDVTQLIKNYCYGVG